MIPEALGVTWKEILVLAFMAGGVWFELKAIRRDIKRLEQKQDKYNNLQERTHLLEIWRQEHEEDSRHART